MKINRLIFTHSSSPRSKNNGDDLLTGRVQRQQRLTWHETGSMHMQKP
jgi:hypothetical protein